MVWYVWCGEQWLNIKSSLAMPMIICSAQRVAINFAVRQERFLIEQTTIHNQATLNLLHVAGHLAWWDRLPSPLEHLQEYVLEYYIP